MVTSLKRFPDPVTSVEQRWFSALDGRVVEADGHVHRLHVEGVHRNGEEVWVQVAPLSAFENGVVIHCWQDQSPTEILGCLGRHLDTAPGTHFIDAFPFAPSQMRGIHSAQRTGLRLDDPSEAA